MARTLDVKVGTFLRIPLEDGTFGYGRALHDPDMAFYDFRTTEPISDLDVIEAQSVLFTPGVRLRDVDNWVQLGVRPLKGEVARPVVNFMQDLADYRKCRIFDTAGMKKNVTPEECIGIERASIWDGDHIAERLHDHFMGRPNEDEIRSRVRLQPDDRRRGIPRRHN